MRFLKTLAVLGLVATAAAACDGVTNPVDEFGTLEGPYVKFVSSSASAPVGAEDPVLVVVQLPTRVEENVTATYSFGGTAVLGQDFQPVDADGNPRSDVTAAGGTANLPYVFDNTASPRDTLRLQILPTATPGRTLEISLTGAQTASGQPIETGYIDKFKQFVLTITEP
jgi:hypothetical protein